MRNVVLAMFMSLDGYIAGPGGTIVPPPYSPDLQRLWIDHNNDRGDVFLYGRTAYEYMAGFWMSDAAPAAPAAALAAKPKVVFSRTLAEAKWPNTRIVRDGIPAEIARLKAAEGRDVILLGGAGIAGSLIEQGLIDQYRLLVSPRLLGGGVRLFEGAHPRRNLTLVDATRFDSGSMLPDLPGRS